MKFTSDVVIGLEIHVELNTKTKLFCSCTNHAENPNEATCPICLGHPGSKPVLNERVLDYAMKLALALNCKIARELVFSRKTYFYPDNSKNYQITQYEMPLGKDGHVTLSDSHTVGLERIHIEEDPATLSHPGGMHSSTHVLVDYNRSGHPLCEIVTKPEIQSADQARDFMKQLKTVLSYLGIFDLKGGIIKADVNVSVKESGYIRSEVKNVTGFKDIERAVEYEISRQQQAVKSGEKLIQDTRGWDSEQGITRRLRTKETEADYGYIIDPDLVPTDLTQEYIDQIAETVPELHHEKAQRFVNDMSLKEEDARVLASERILAQLFEEVAQKVNPLLAAKWLRRELVRVMNYNKIEFDDLVLDQDHMIELLQMLDKKEITDNVAQKILEKLIEEPFSPKEYVEKEGLKAVSDSNELEKFCKEAISEQPKAVEDYKKGEEKALNFIVGQVMRKTRGSAAPDVVQELLKKLIE